MTKKIKPIMLLSLLSPALILFFLVPGCGYQMGSIMHPQVKSIAIAPVLNETMIPNAAAFMRQALAEQFQWDASIRVESMEKADCILYGRILDVKNKSTMQQSYDGEQRYTPSEWDAEVKFEFVVIIPGRTEALIPNRQVVGHASYQVLADHEITKKRGIQQACRDAAEQAVVYTVEAW